MKVAACSGKGGRRSELQPVCDATTSGYGQAFEDRQDLLGHRSGQITTHYSAAQLQNLQEAANCVCEEKSRTDGAEKKSACRDRSKRLILRRILARPAGFEPTTP